MLTSESSMLFYILLGMCFRPTPKLYRGYISSNINITGKANTVLMQCLYALLSITHTVYLVLRISTQTPSLSSLSRKLLLPKKSTLCKTFLKGVTMAVSIYIWRNVNHGVSLSILIRWLPVIHFIMSHNQYMFYNDKWFMLAFGAQQNQYFWGCSHRGSPCMTGHLLYVQRRGQRGIRRHGISKVHWDFRHLNLLTHSFSLLFSSSLIVITQIGYMFQEGIRFWSYS